MKLSELFGRPSKSEIKSEDTTSAKLLVQAGFISKLGSGSYDYLPMGFKVLKKIENIIREEFDKIGAQEFLNPIIHPATLWEESGRLKDFGPELVVFKNRNEQELVIAPTHEETISRLAKKYISSYQDLPLIVNQIQTKYRDEPRPRGGLLRVREFIMQDAYSFDLDKKGLDAIYDKVRKVYQNIFTRCGLDLIIVDSDVGAMGGYGGEEFMLLNKQGEDRLIICRKGDYQSNKEVAEISAGQKCPNCGTLTTEERGIELGHIFKLGKKYSESLGVSITDKEGKKINPEMGCYGIGLGRLMAAVIERYHDEKGMIWPEEISPYDYHLIFLGDAKEQAQKVYDKLVKKGKTVLFDDRDESAGVKFNDADLIGIPNRLIVSDKTIKEDKIELSERGEEKEKLVGIGEL